MAGAVRGWLRPSESTQIVPICMARPCVARRNVERVSACLAFSLRESCSTRSPCEGRTRSEGSVTDSVAVEQKSPATTFVGGASCLPTTQLSRANIGGVSLVACASLCVRATPSIGINSLELDRQAVPPAVAGAVLTRWCHSASVSVDPRRACNKRPAGNITPDLRSTRRAR